MFENDEGLIFAEVFQFRIRNSFLVGASKHNVFILFHSVLSKEAFAHVIYIYYVH